MLDDLYVVQSPLQLLGAIEAAHKFGPARKTLILRFLPDTRNASQVKALLKLSTWEHILLLPYWVGWRSKFNFLQDLWFVRKVSKMNLRYLFLGDIRPLDLRLVAANTSAKQTYLLDDGMFNFTYFHTPELLAPFFEGKQRIGALLKATLLVKVFRLSDKLPPMGFFSFFSLGDSTETRPVIRHGFEYLRAYTRMHKLKPLNDTVFFLGQPYSELGMLSEEYYFEVLHSVGRLYPDKKMVYASHRRESDAKLERIKKIGWEIARYENIIEVEFFLKYQLPVFITGLASTALITLPLVYPGLSPIAMPIDLNQLSPDHRERIRNLYALMQQNGVKVSPSAIHSI